MDQPRHLLKSCGGSSFLIPDTERGRSIAEGMPFEREFAGSLTLFAGALSMLVAGVYSLPTIVETVSSSMHFGGLLEEMLLLPLRDDMRVPLVAGLLGWIALMVGWEARDGSPLRRAIQQGYVVEIRGLNLEDAPREIHGVDTAEFLYSAHQLGELTAFLNSVTQIGALDEAEVETLREMGRLEGSSQSTISRIAAHARRESDA